MQRYCRMKSEERDLSNKLCPATLIGNAATFTYEINNINQLSMFIYR